MRLSPFILAVVMVLATACTKTNTEAPATPVTASGAKIYGKALSKAAATVELAALLKDPTAWIDKTVAVTGHVRKSCEKKGCWMELATAGDKNAPGCRVTFKDYGFFVPLDAAGSKARLEGVVTINTLEADVVAHYEAEGARFTEKNEDGTAKELHITATGVELSARQ